MTGTNPTHHSPPSTHHDSEEEDEEVSLIPADLAEGSNDTADNGIADATVPAVWAYLLFGDDYRSLIPIEVQNQVTADLEGKLWNGRLQRTCAGHPVAYEDAARSCLKEIFRAKQPTIQGNDCQP